MGAESREGGMEPDDEGPMHSEMIVIRTGDPDADAKLLAFQERIRARIGDEAFERHQRTRELMRNPRELTDAQKALLWQALAPVLRDLEATGQTPPLIREQSREDPGDEAICAWIEAPDGTGQGIRVWLNGSDGYQLCSLADQLQEWMVDQWATWPVCPVHLDANHPLEADIRDGVAVWRCSRSGQTVAPIGSLP